MIIVENYGDKPVSVNNENISVMFEGNSIDWSSKNINLETVFDVMKDVRMEMMSRNRRIQRGRTPADFTNVIRSTPASLPVPAQEGPSHQSSQCPQH
ncbi:hypothetical protein ACFL1N_15275 [Thermodesulfobacteriota bacterium]